MVNLFSVSEKALRILLMYGRIYLTIGGCVVGLFSGKFSVDGLYKYFFKDKETGFKCGKNFLRVW